MYPIISEEFHYCTATFVKIKAVSVIDKRSAIIAFRDMNMDMVIALDEKTGKFRRCSDMASVEEFYNPPCERCGGSGWLVTKKHGIDPNYPNNLPDSGWPTDYLAKEACPLCTASADGTNSGTHLFHDKG